MFMVEIKIGSKIRGKEIKDLIKLRNGWLLLKTENGKSAQDFRVRFSTFYRTATFYSA